MVINSRFKFIFVHIPKTGGRSVKKSLTGIRGNRKRWLADTNHETLSSFHANLEGRRSWRDGVRGRTAKDYFSFAFVRNPWDRMSSLYHFLVEKRPKHEIDSVLDFKDFLLQVQQGVGWIKGLHSTKSQLDYFTRSGNRLSLDYVGHFEFLSEDFDCVLKQIGCPAAITHVNRSTNSAKDYRKAYDDEMIEIVASRFAEEIDLFGYKFEQREPEHRRSGPVDCPRNPRPQTSPSP